MSSTTREKNKTPYDGESRDEQINRKLGRIDSSYAYNVTLLTSYGHSLLLYMLRETSYYSSRALAACTGLKRKYYNTRTLCLVLLLIAYIIALWRHRV